MFKRILMITSVMIFMAGCSSVTISPNGMGKLSSEPTYQESKSYYFFGLAGEHHIDVVSICNGEEPLQMQSQQTFLDGLLGAVTLGIYSPHTAKVWCPKESK